jgi:predicted nucleic acid-binding protein
VITADTNVLVYLFDTAAPAKQRVAQQALAVLGRRNGSIGLQVIGELQNVLRRKFRQPLGQVAHAARLFLNTFQIFVASEANADESLTLMAQGHLAYWDALLVTAARDAGCVVFFSEDMQDGARFGSLEIINPFGPGGGPSARLRALLSP